ncbi:MAG: hypothetical protein P4L57_06755 [Rhizomicrobium sp.]|nr:hypothetical protein [Rhizomicrobium sp.]
MADKQNGSARFFRLGAVFWLLVAALVGIAHFFWGVVSESVPFVIGAVFVAVLGGFVIVYFARSK